MKSASLFQLKDSNSFSVASKTVCIHMPANESELKALADISQQPFYIMGEGSNTLFLDDKAPVIIRPDFKGISIEEYSEHYLVRVGAGENWHQLVCTCIKQGVAGLENLALIPGSVGAAPVQNIGAYGVEFADYCSYVDWFEFSSQTMQRLTSAQCKFGYRDSIFKQALYNQGVITAIGLTLKKKWHANLSYSGLDALTSDVTPVEVMEQVIAIRQSKLPDPRLIPNAGSFFKNPVVSTSLYQQLKDRFPDMPFYPQKNGAIKLAAGWLIEQTGLKGFCQNGAGVHAKQALVLINKGGASGRDIVNLALYVQKKVLEMFAVNLLPEVRLISEQGELTLDELALDEPALGEFTMDELTRDEHQD